ncbi:MAG: hypothetical protein ABI718_13885 [Acidobacteriota bacterium]
MSRLSQFLLPNPVVLGILRRGATGIRNGQFDTLNYGFGRGLEEAPHGSDLPGPTNSGHRIALTA